MAKTAALRPHDQYSRWGGRSRSDGDWRSNRDSLSTSQPSKKLDQYSRWGGRTRSDGDWRSNRARDSLSTSQPSKKLEIFKRGEEVKAKLLFGGENKDFKLKLCTRARLAPYTDDQ
ncbi:hypothetical protein BVRB_8g192240 [Beta vulgaris subsp. vulgaris]|nr:hypothetical protein BVRB_8g192240 [Beta vulgaris subsp. vulgaris]